MMPLWAEELAGWFWRRAGGPAPFPRDLLDALERGAFLVTLVERPGLTVRKAENYLAHQGIHAPGREPDRPLRGCIASRGGAAVVFVDADDPPDERATSVAHEIGHYLRHCLRPRLVAERALGPTVRDVLDGRRSATHSEELAALFRGVSLDVAVHFWHRDGSHLSPADRLAEREADWMAWHLLAPFDEVVRRVGAEDDLSSVAGVLRAAFGLPAPMADAYADALCPEDEARPMVARLEHHARAGRGRGRARGGR